MADILTSGQIVRDLTGNAITGSFFEGVYALNELPPLPLQSTPSLLVCNTAARYANSDGEHWVAFFVGPGEVQYFDSYGLPPADPTLQKFVATNANGGIFDYNSKCLQNLLSTTCGKYATTYLYYRSLGYTLGQYLELFDGGGDADEIVRKMYASIFGAGRCPEGQICRPRIYKKGAAV